MDNVRVPPTAQLPLASIGTPALRPAFDSDLWEMAMSEETHWAGRPALVPLLWRLALEQLIRVPASLAVTAMFYPIIGGCIEAVLSIDRRTSIVMVAAGWLLWLLADPLLRLVGARFTMCEVTGRHVRVTGGIFVKSVREMRVSDVARIDLSGEFLSCGRLVFYSGGGEWVSFGTIEGARRVRDVVRGLHTAPIQIVAADTTQSAVSLAEDAPPTRCSDTPAQLLPAAPSVGRDVVRGTQSRSEPNHGDFCGDPRACGPIGIGCVQPGVW